MAKSRKQSKPKVPDNVRQDVEKKANELVDTFLKPNYVKPPPEDNQFNYVADIYTKWYRNYFYFCSTYNSPGPYAISPSFEDKFARLEYVRHDRYNLSYMRYTGQWWLLYQGYSLEDCFNAIKDEPHFQP
jgi:hypothetical protein